MQGWCKGGASAAQESFRGSGSIVVWHLLMFGFMFRLDPDQKMLIPTIFSGRLPRWALVRQQLRFQYRCLSVWGQVLGFSRIPKGSPETPKTKPKNRTANQSCLDRCWAPKRCQNVSGQRLCSGKPSWPFPITPPGVTSLRLNPSTCFSCCKYVEWCLSFKNCET